jgi:Lon-like ATP-dependent protease
MNKKFEDNSSAMHCLGENLNRKNGFITVPMELVNEQDIINTYSEEERSSCQKYFEYKKLIKENPLLGYKRCAKLLGIPQGRTRWWHTNGAKKAIPVPLKTLAKLNEGRFLPFCANHENSKAILRILGTLFGDGGIDKRFNTVAFISSDKRDIDLWHQDLLRIFSFAQGKTQLVEGGEYGHSYNIRCYDRAVVRFFAALGAPVGNKVSTIYTLPKYIFDLPRHLKIAFLDGLLSSEVSVPNFRGDKRWNWTKRFTNFALGLSKIDALEEQHKAFLESFKKLCASIGLTCTPNLRKDTSKIIERKDGHKSCCYRIFFQTHFEKVIRFNETFPLRYATDKKQRLEEEIKKALGHKQGVQA